MTDKNNSSAPGGDWPCHAGPQSEWCDRHGPGGFMGHTCYTRATQPPAERSRSPYVLGVKPPKSVEAQLAERALESAPTNDQRATDALKNIRDLACFDSSTQGDVYYAKAEDAMAAIECRDAVAKPAPTLGSAPQADASNIRDQITADANCILRLLDTVDKLVGGASGATESIQEHAQHIVKFAAKIAAPKEQAAERPFRERFKDAYECLSVAAFSSPFWNQSMEQLLSAVDAEINKRAAPVAERAAVPEGWNIERIGGTIEISHPAIGKAVTHRGVTDPADVVLHHLAESLLAAAPSPAAQPVVSSDESTVAQEGKVLVRYMDEIFNDEIKRVTSLDYPADSMCRAFYDNLRKRVANIVDGQTDVKGDSK